MKIILERWKHFLNENEEEGESFSFRVFCDMDGVLVDLPGGLLQRINISNASPEFKKTTMRFISMAEKKGTPWQNYEESDEYGKSVRFIYDSLTNNRDFWATLPPTEDAQVLWSGLQKYNLYVLSAPWEVYAQDGSKVVDEACKAGKRDWIANFDSQFPQSKIILRSDKYSEALQEDGTPNILIDDMEKYRKPFSKAGGEVIEHREGQATETLNKLDKIINKSTEK